MIAGNPMSKNKAQILIVDDEIYIQEILKSTLENAGYDCVADILKGDGAVEIGDHGPFGLFHM